MFIKTQYTVFSGFNMETQKLNAMVMLAAFLTIIVMTALASTLTNSQKVQNFGNVKTTVNLGIYSDQGCTIPLMNITWGEVIPGQNYLRTIYIKNLGNVKVTLSMRTGNWTPSQTSSYLTLTWDRENTPLDAGLSIRATLTLTVSPTAQGGPFSFDILIIATENQ